MATEAEIRHGLEGNSFLIWEMLDDFINSVAGGYNRLSLWEYLRGENGNKELQKKYSELSLSIGGLTFDLANADEPVLIDKVVELWREYHQVNAIEERDYANDSASYMAKHLVVL